MIRRLLSRLTLDDGALVACLLLAVLGGCAAGDVTPAGDHVVVNASVPSRPEVVRDADGTIYRSPAARRAFRHRHPCPATGQSTGACPGWVVDHVVPLACGGADTPANMQWQTRYDALAKDKWERAGPECGKSGARVGHP